MVPKYWCTFWYIFRSDVKILACITIHAKLNIIPFSHMNVQDMCNRNILVLFGQRSETPRMSSDSTKLWEPYVLLWCKFWIYWVGVNTKKTNNMSCHINCKCCIYYHPVSSKFTTWQLYTPQFCIKWDGSTRQFELLPSVWFN